MLKAISLWQPWDSAMAVSIKQNETRSWPTTFRGQLAICAAKRKPSPFELSHELTKTLWEHKDRFDGHKANFGDLIQNLPYGQVLCVVELYDCVRTETIRDSLTEWELACGDYTPGRFAWRTRNCIKLDVPMPVVGRQGLFNLPADVEEKVRNQF